MVTGSLIGSPLTCSHLIISPTTRKGVGGAISLGNPFLCPPVSRLPSQALPASLSHSHPQENLLPLEDWWVLRVCAPAGPLFFSQVIWRQSLCFLCLFWKWCHPLPNLYYPPLCCQEWPLGKIDGYNFLAILPEFGSVCRKGKLLGVLGVSGPRARLHSQVNMHQLLSWRWAPPVWLASILLIFRFVFGGEANH